MFSRLVPSFAIHRAVAWQKKWETIENIQHFCTMDGTESACNATVQREWKEKNMQVGRGMHWVISIWFLYMMFFFHFAFEHSRAWTFSILFIWFLSIFPFIGSNHSEKRFLNWMPLFPHSFFFVKDLFLCCHHFVLFVHNFTYAAFKKNMNFPCCCRFCFFLCSSQCTLIVLNFM